MAYPYNEGHVAMLQVRVLAMSWARLIPLLAFAYGAWSLLAIVVSWHPRHGINGSLLWGVVSIVFSLLIGIGLHPRMVARRTLSALPAAEQGNTRWYFDATGARYERGGTAGAFRWELISLLMRFPDGILVVGDRNYWWPAKAFATQEQFSQVERWARSSASVSMVWNDNRLWDWLAALLLSPLFVIAVSTLMSTSVSSAYLASGNYLLQNALERFLITGYAINTIILAPILFICIRAGRSGLGYAIAIGIFAGAVLWLIDSSRVATIPVEPAASPAIPLLGFMACAVCMWWIATQRYFGGPIVTADQSKFTLD